MTGQEMAGAVDVLIIGAGPTGIRMARALDRAGIAKFRVLERDGALGRAPSRGTLPSRIHRGREVTACEFDEHTDRWRVTTAGGEVHHARVVIRAHDLGRDLIAGQRIAGREERTLHQRWSGGVEAFNAVAVHGFPNLFLMPAPVPDGGTLSRRRTGAVQARYILRCLELMRRHGASRIEVRAAVQREFNRWLRQERTGTAVRSDERAGGRLAGPAAGGAPGVFWVGSPRSYRRRLRRLNPAHFDCTTWHDREPEHAYHGPATLSAGERQLPVTVTLSGHVEPIDGKYHWYGRVHAQEEVAALQRANRSGVSLSLPGRQAVPGRLVERDPWGHVRVAGTGTPPYPVETLSEIEAEAAGAG
ncbi:DUF4873 domain-containing protein [Haloechinothrix sp. LS1_15]|uniref:DUF4873 domain-containing protein n=1 Tax=Haloechinothrix sp. LS1_15 TaxID=2652248 RepID=UPI0029457A93|nr:DUF4873 domain-containing protein [Haloechinothrix sp. LS1_15]MDV6012882.1 DUF4873 domain-containing protein [Haloechinothrix sp. LS1_15]